MAMHALHSARGMVYGALASFKRSWQQTRLCIFFGGGVKFGGLEDESLHIVVDERRLHYGTNPSHAF